MNVSLAQCICARRQVVAQIRGYLSHQFSRLCDYELDIQKNENIYCCFNYLYNVVYNCSYHNFIMLFMVL